ncbi:CopG family transcriptional regulator [Methylobacterium sp. Leaf399]|nr:CopG family transcriptional regulator [Methylobacterium sp. Leaf399]
MQADAVETAVTALRLPPELVERLDALAQRTGRSVIDHARDAIVGHLDDLDDLAIAEQRLEALRRGDSDTVPLVDLLVRYGVEH